MKISLSWIAGSTFVASLWFPLFARAATYVTAQDLQETSKTLAALCADKDYGSDVWRTCINDAIGLARANIKQHARVTIKKSPITFSLLLPTPVAWRLGENSFQPYTPFPLEGTKTKAFLFGPPNISCTAIQDVVCEVTRDYSLQVYKGFINPQIKNFKALVAQFKKNKTFEGEELAPIEFRSNGLRIVLMPKLTENSGGAWMEYGKLLVEKNGAVFEFSGAMDTELWRVAASLR